MKELLKSVSRLSVSTFLNILSSVLKSKILALVAGPAGVGIYSQFINLSALTTSIFPIGSLGVLNYTSNYFEKQKLDEIGIIIGYFLKRNILYSIVFSLLMIFFSENLSNILFSNNQFSDLIVLFAVFIPVNLCLSFLDIYLKGIRKLNIYVIFLSINSIISTIVTLILIYFYSVQGAIFGLIASISINLLFGLLILKKNKLTIKLSFRKSVDSVIKKNIYALGIGSIVTLISQNFSILIIKSILAEDQGISSVGIFQSVYSISAAYFGIFFTLIGSYSIPKMSSFNNINDMIIEMNTTMRFLLIVYTPVIITMFVLRIYIINILYSSEFLDAQNLLVYQLPAELIRGMSWVIGLWLIPNFKIKQWIFFDLIFYSLFIALFYIFLKLFNLHTESVSLSYFISYLIYFLINYFYAFKKINFRLDSQNTKMLILSVTLISFIFIISNYYITISYFILLPVVIFWIIVFLKKVDFASMYKNLINTKK